jgi:hypothetical protein
MAIEWGFLAVIIALEIMHRIERQTLINKIMSRNYGEYVQSEALKKPDNGSKSNVEPELPEDLRSLQELSL